MIDYIPIIIQIALIPTAYIVVATICIVVIYCAPYGAWIGMRSSVKRLRK